LFFSSYIVFSEEGPQQGDPIGPLLFSNTIHPVLSSLEASLNLGNVDNVTLGGTVKAVASDVAKIVKAGTEIGLSLNVSKCEFIAHKDFQVDDALLQSFHRVELEDVSLLGAPLFPGAELDTAWDDRCEDLTRAADRLSAIGAQDALILLRSSFSAPKVLHLLRCCPPADHPVLGRHCNLSASRLPTHTSLEPPLRQVRQQKLPLPARRSVLP